MLDATEHDNAVISELLESIEALRPSAAPFFPPQARENNAPYIERHTIASGRWAFTLWHNDIPVAINLDHTYEAVDAYLGYLQEIATA